MINVRAATELFGFVMIRGISPLYEASSQKGYTLLFPVRIRSFASGMKPGVCFCVRTAPMLKPVLIAFLIVQALVAPAQRTAADPDEVDALFRKGERAYSNGTYAEAIQFYTRVLEIDPEYLNAYLQRGFCHSLQREYEKAITDFSSVIDRKPDHLWAYTSRGSAYGKWGKQELAIQDFNTVLQLDPRNQEAYNNRGWAKKAAGDHKAACQDWVASRKMGNAEAKIILKNNQCK
jgi:tetratricopeptide (TPR) repeat protein